MLPIRQIIFRRLAKTGRLQMKYVAHLIGGVSDGDVVMIDYACILPDIQVIKKITIPHLSKIKLCDIPINTNEKEIYDLVSQIEVNGLLHTKYIKRGLLKNFLSTTGELN